MHISRDSARELAGGVALLAVLILIPVLVWGYQNHLVRKDLPEDAVVIELYGSAVGGTWTTEPIVGWNYWWKGFSRDEAVRIPAGRTVVLRVTSTDVLHSFALPTERAYRRPVDVEPGKWITVVLESREEDETIPFLCWQWCSPDHEVMQGELVSLPAATFLAEEKASSANRPGGG